MQRRTLLHLGLGSAALLAVAAASLSTVRPVWLNQQLTGPSQAVFRAVARAILAGVLPAQVDTQAQALQDHLQRLEATIAGLPAAMQAELQQLLTLLAHPVGRVTLAGLQTDWPAASLEEVQAALQRMRSSRIGLRQQAYHALRDLTNAGYFSGPDTWAAAMGYPGPQPV